MTDVPYRIVVGVDGSEGGDRALDWALRQAASYGGTVEAVAAWSWDGSDATTVNAEHTQERTRQMLATHLTTALGDTGPQVTVTATTALGEPAEALVGAAVGADLLVLGSHGHGRLFHAVLGSVADRCVRAARCPVVVVPAPHDDPTESPGAQPPGPLPVFY